MDAELQYKVGSTTEIDPESDNYFIKISDLIPIVNPLDPLSPTHRRSYMKDLREQAWNRQLMQFNDAQVFYQFIEAFVVEVQHLYDEILKMQDWKTLHGGHDMWLTIFAENIGTGRTQWRFYDYWWWTHDTSDTDFFVDQPDTNRVLNLEEKTPVWVTDTLAEGENLTVEDAYLRAQCVARVLMNVSRSDEYSWATAIQLVYGINVAAPKYYTGTGTPNATGSYDEPYTVHIRIPNGTDPNIIDAIRYPIQTSIADNVFMWQMPAIITIKGIYIY